MTLQPEIQFPAHTRERSLDGTAHVQKNHTQFSNQCKKLMMFWQKKNGRIWLSNEDGRQFNLSSYLSARVYDLLNTDVTPKIQIEKMNDGKIKRFRLVCSCRIVGGEIQTENCWAHSEKLKVE